MNSKGKIFPGKTRPRKLCVFSSMWVYPSSHTPGTRFLATIRCLACRIGAILCKFEGGWGCGEDGAVERMGLRGGLEDN